MASSLQVRAVEVFDEESTALDRLDDSGESARIDGLGEIDVGEIGEIDPIDPTDSIDVGNPDGQSLFPLPPPPSSAAGALARLRALGVGLRSAREVGGGPPGAACQANPAAASSPQAPWAPAGPEPLATAVPALDELLAGGLPRGKLVEMVGARSSGRFSAVLATLAAATAAGEAAALVDLGDGLDPQAAATLGMDLRRLLWLRPVSLKQALVCAEVLLGGGFPLVVLDLGSPPVRGGRGGEAGWVRLARAAQAHRAALLVASPYRMSGTAAALVLQAARGRVLWLGAAGRGPRLLDGLSCQLALEKSRGRLLPAQRSRRLELRMEDTISLDAFPPTAAAAAAPSSDSAGSAAGSTKPTPLAKSAAVPDPAGSAASSNSARSAGSAQRASLMQ